MSVAWPEKMITQAEAFAKAADWPLWIDALAKGTAYLRCRKDDCDQSCGQLVRDGTPYNASLDEMLSMVLRHMVMAHDVPLNTRPMPAGIAKRMQDNRPSDGSTP